ncbi:MAG TPA: hypothetical protein IAD18_04500 [Candidatus Limisoma intestinavium]|uniref:Uncharacterized protein n=1 Tax=Candidatus Limisoma intestinavium TaxID=2840856 RepID=A0A9D1IN99_9BACT|nr:hypothetical protein [Candidatus Limisoma intestinavium]
MKTIIHLALLCMAMLMSQSCGGASHKNSDSETDLESLSNISFKTIPPIWMDSHTGKWEINRIWEIIVCDDSGTPIMYDKKMAASYDSLAFAFFYATNVAKLYSIYNSYKWEKSTFNSRAEALNKWESDFAPEIDPYLSLCLNLPIAATDDTCPSNIRDYFNELYYEYKDEDMILHVPPYAYDKTSFDFYYTDRRYQINNGYVHSPNIFISGYDGEDFPEYHGALSILLADP